MTRRLIGAALALLGAWLLWAPIQPALLYINRGAPVVETLVDPVFLMPILRGVAALVGGLLALNMWRFGPWFSGAAAVISLVLGGLFLAIGQGAVPYVPHLAYGVILAGLTAGLIRLPRDTIAA
ncbi:MAG: hypothetical protein AAF253_12640 [Pseudomonadota bacterium]